jgi:Uma2 family endonuclease
MRHTLGQYLALEEEGQVRHEYFDGEIYAMAGGTPDHAGLAAVALRLVGNRLPRGCRAYTSDLRVRIDATGLSTYPDGSVVCGKTVRSSEDPLAVVNPSLLIEVTSASTEEYDRGTKLEHYQALSSVREVLIVSHREPRLTVHHRGEDGTWVVEEAYSGGSVKLRCIGAELDVDDVFRDGLEDAGR